MAGLPRRLQIRALLEGQPSLTFALGDEVTKHLTFARHPMEQPQEKSYAQRKNEEYEAERRFRMAVNDGDLMLAAELLDQGVSPNVRWDDWSRAVALHRATSKENGDQWFQLLMKHGADVNAVDAEGQTALHVAAIAGRLKIVRALLTLGTDPNLQDKEGKTALDCAFGYGKDAILPLLSPVTDHQDIHAAVIAGDLSKVRAILDTDPSWATRKLSINGETLLHEAVRLGYQQIVELLLAHGADVQARSYTTPLKLAYARHYGEIAELLKKHRATH
jgi:ankyrin repeat protein